jgi:hypothetical protein
MQSNLPDVASEPSPAYTPNFAGEYSSPGAPMDPALEPFMRKLEAVTAQPPTDQPGETLGAMMGRSVRELPRR